MLQYRNFVCYVSTMAKITSSGLDKFDLLLCIFVIIRDHDYFFKIQNTVDPITIAFSNRAIENIHI